MNEFWHTTGPTASMNAPAEVGAFTALASSLDHTRAPVWPIGGWPAVHGECGAAPHGAQDGSRVLDGVGREPFGVGPDQARAFGGLAVGGLAVPPVWLEHEAETGMG